MATIDEEIALRLEQAATSGELQAAPSYGKPLAVADGWEQTPEALRLPFKILKDSGFAPPEVALFHQRAELRARVQAAPDAQERGLLQQRLNELEQKISLRLESLRGRARD